MTTVDTFEPLTAAEVTTVTAKAEESKVDPVWAQRISTLPVGGGFRISRTEGEPQRTLKTRINRAAESSGRKLDWYPQSGTLTDGKPSSYVVKVKALNLQAATTSQNAQNGPIQPQQPTEGENTDNQPSEENTSQGPRRARP